jgi:flagellar biogenesis protein FliO
VAGRTLVLGVTDSSVSVLGEADPLLLAAEQALAPDADQERATPGWGPLLEALKERTVRRS